MGSILVKLIDLMVRRDKHRTMKLKQSVTRLKFVLRVIVADAGDKNALVVGHPRMNLGN